MKIDGALYHRRADIIGFVNGIPLLFVEFKKLGVVFAKPMIPTITIISIPSRNCSGSMLL